MSTEQAPQIYGLMSSIMKEIGAVSKDQRNKDQGYSFRGIEDLLNAAHPVLARHGVFFLPTVLKTASENRVAKSGAQMIRVTAEIQHRFYAPDGSSVDAVTIGEAIDSSDKGSNKVMSFAMKYALIEAFCIPTKDMDDGDSVSPEAGVRPLDVPRTDKAIPIAAKGTTGNILPDAEDLITTEQAQKLHIRFREALCDALKPKAEALLHDFLARRMYVDANGNPSAGAIRKTEFAKIGPEAMRLAKELNAAEQQEVA